MGYPVGYSGAALPMIATNSFIPQTEQTRDTFLTGEYECAPQGVSAFAGGTVEGGVPLIWNAANRERTTSITAGANTCIRVGTGTMEAAEMEVFTDAITAAQNAWLD